MSQLHSDKSRRARPVTPARRVAFDVLYAVDQADAYANLALPPKIAAAGLNAQDAALATELTYGTLRMQGFYDAVISNAAARDIGTIDPATLTILRLGTHQLLNMRIADHAAVDESVNLADHKSSRGSTGFVNAVLRRISRHDATDWREFLSRTITDEDERLALVHSHPVWIVRALRKSLKLEHREEELEELLNSDNINPLVTLVELPGFESSHELEGIPTSLAPTAIILEGGDPARLARVQEGTVRVQDEGSQLAALTLSRHHAIQPGEKWLDMCAGPGGKAALLAAEASQHNVDFEANEVIPARAKLVENALSIFPTVSVDTHDGREYGDMHPDTYDRIMLDAPCTGLGALRRRPEARWRKSPRDVGELSTLQSELLTSAIKALKPGGVLAYVTCSPHLAETRAILDSALRKNPHLTELNAREVIQSVSKSALDLDTETLSVQLWPHRHNTDAMFISLLTKSE